MLCIMQSYQGMQENTNVMNVPWDHFYNITLLVIVAWQPYKSKEPLVVYTLQTH